MFTYDSHLTRYRDWVRLLTRDIDPLTALLPDETISALLGTLGYAPAIAQICDILIAQYANEPDYLQEHLGLEVRWSQRVAAWRELAGKARAGLLTDPFAATASNHTIALQQTNIQQAVPGRPLPSSVPAGILGGFRAD